MLKSMLVKDYMIADHLAFLPDTDVLKATQDLLDHRLSGAPVVDDKGVLIGFLSEKDALKVALNASYYEEPAGTVRQYMTAKVVALGADTSLADAIELFVNQPYRCYPVVSDSRVVGQLSRREALIALQKLW